MKKQIQNSEVWLSTKEVCGICGIKNQTFQYHRQKNNYLWREAECEDGSKFEVLLSSLPPEAVAKYNNHLIMNSNEETEIEFKANISDKDKELALAKDAFMRLYFRFADNSKHGKIKAKKRFIEIFNQGKLYENIFKKIGEVNFKTIETHWKPNWLKSGKDPLSLAPKQRERKSTVTTQEAQLLLNYSLTPGSDRPIRQCARDAREQMIIKNYHSVKSEQTYVRWIEDFKEKNLNVWTLVRQGEKRYKDTIQKPVKRDYSKIEVGDIIVGDGHKLNFEILDPFTNSYRRMNMILFHDMKSDLPLGWDISLTEDTRTITIAFYRAIMRLGKIPEIVYLDNGRAFRSKYLNGQDLEESGTIGLFERLGCQVTFARPYNAKAKTVERFFNTFSELEMKIPTYCGTSIAKKPARMMRNEKMHKQIYEKIMQNTVIDLWTAHHLIAAYFDQYSERIKKSGRMKGQSPWELFKAGMGDGIDKSLLLWFMMEEKERLVYNEGINLLGNLFYHEDLTDYVGRRLNVRYDIINLDYIYVLDNKNNLICRADNDKGVHPAAYKLGNETDVQQLQQRLSLQDRQLKNTYAKASSLLTGEMLPAISRQIQEADQLRRINSGEVRQAKEEEKKKSAFSKIKVSVPQKNNSEEMPKSFYQKTAEG